MKTFILIIGIFFTIVITAHVIKIYNFVKQGNKMWILSLFIILLLIITFIKILCHE